MTSMRHGRRRGPPTVQGDVWKLGPGRLSRHCGAHWDAGLRSPAGPECAEEEVLAVARELKLGFEDSANGSVIKPLVVF